jgi:hypothetical protein
MSLRHAEKIDRVRRPDTFKLISYYLPFPMCHFIPVDYFSLLVFRSTNCVFKTPSCKVHKVNQIVYLEW